MVLKLKNQHGKMILSICAILILIGSEPCIVLWAVYLRFAWPILYIWPYEGFRAQERNAAPLFDAQNEAVLAEIPPPAGAMEVERTKRGIYEGYGITHGRILYVTYQLGGEAPNDIVNYYRQYLLSNGWNGYSDGSAIAILSRGSSCVMVTTPDRSGLNYDYRLRIWHDFEKQPFSPKIPYVETDGMKTPMNLISNFEFGESEFLTCP